MRRCCHRVGPRRGLRFSRKQHYGGRKFCTCGALEYVRPNTPVETGVAETPIIPLKFRSRQVLHHKIACRFFAIVGLPRRC
jgi:hypothetical protein